MKLKSNLIVAGILLAITGCTKIEQSQLDFDTIKATANISGQIVYDAGVDKADDSFAIRKYVPAAAKTVFVEIDFKEYDIDKANSDNKGKKIFETVTDENGVYTIDVPVWSEGVKATVRMQEFTAQKTVYAGTDDAGAPVLKTEMYRYKFVKDIPCLKPGTIEFFDKDKFICEEVRVSLDEFKDKRILTGNIQLAVEKEYLTGAYEPATEVPLLFSVTYNSGEQPYLYNSKTDATGRFTVEIPVVDQMQSIYEIVLVVSDQQKVDYKHFTAPGKSKVIKGSYKSLMLANGMLPGLVSDKKIDLGTMYVRFDPTSISEQELPAPSDPIYNGFSLAGWEQYNGFTAEAAITGKYLLAEESAYKVGAYTNSLQTAYFEVTYTDNVRAGVGSSRIVRLAVSTDADGNFSFTLPLTDANEVLPVTPVALNGNGFKHFVSANEAKLLKGNYTFRIRKDMDKPWNELGTSYGVFTPAAFEPTWDPDLTGWRVFENQNVAKTVSAEVYAPVETAYGTAAYVPAENLTAKLNVSFGTVSDDYTVVVKEGKINTTIYLDEETTVPNLTLTINATAPDFQHFSATGRKERVAGKYTLGTWTGRNEKDRASWNDLGKVYLNFDPDTDPVSWNDWYKYLAGWIVCEDKTEQTDIAADVKLPVETAFGTASYVNADQLLVKLTVESQTYVFPIAAGKLEGKVWRKNASLEGSIVIDGFKMADNSEFVHYTAPGKKVNLTGTYSKRLWTGELPEDRTSWNQLGTIYMEFTPDPLVPYWTAVRNLAGWQVFQDVRTVKTLKFKMSLPEEESFLKGKYVPADGLLGSVIVNSTDTYVFPLTGGQATVPVQLKEMEKLSNLSIGLVTNDPVRFRHYGIGGRNTVLTGTYNLRRIVAGDDWSETGDLGTVYMEFNPSTSFTDWNTIYRNMSGWHAYDNLPVKKTLTANVFYPRETAFGKGEYYRPEEDVALVKVLHEGTMVTYAFPVKDGIMSGDVYLHHDLQEPDIQMATVSDLSGGIRVNNFVHYAAPGKTIKLSGSLTTKVWTGEKRENRKEWYELGNVYYKFVPASAGKPADWDNYFVNLAGWFAEEGHFVDKTVTGSLFWDRETGFREAQFIPAANRLVTVRVKDTHDNKWRSFVGVTDDQGVYNVPVKVIYEDKLPLPSNVTVAPDFIGKDNIPYDHYRSLFASPETMIEKCEAAYNAGPVFASFRPVIDSWNDRGVMYYERDPQLKYNGASKTVSLNYAGLINKKVELNALQNNKKFVPVTITGDIKKAVIQKDAGTNLMTAKWMPDGQRPVKITVSGQEFLLSAHGGRYSLVVSVLEGTSTLDIKVRPDNDEQQTAFNHYPDPTKPTEIKKLVGTFVSANNVTGTYTIPTTGGKVITLNADKDAAGTGCAKIVFNPNPSGYTWDLTQDK